MKILVLGPNGQVGWELQRSLAPLGQILALARQGEDGLCGDLADPESLAASIKALSPDVIVNAAAHTNVDQAEKEPDLSESINARAPGVMAREARRLGSLLVHYSTDYVFDGSGVRPWREDDIPDPKNVYGRTKLKGEEAVRESDCRHLIFRTSWVYAGRGKNFIHTMLKLATERPSLRVINDQFGAPTGAELIADVTAHAIRAAQKDQSLAGVYHLAATGQTSWWDYARLVMEEGRQAGLELKANADSVEPVASEEFSTPASRPKNSRLDTSKLQETFSIHLPRWEDGVRRCIQEICGGG